MIINKKYETQSINFGSTNPSTFKVSYRDE